MQITPHWTERTLAAALDLAGGGEAGAAARDHADVCPACRIALAHARGAELAVGHALEVLDAPMPELDTTQILAWILAQPSIVQPARVTQRGYRPAGHRRAVWGVGLLVSVAAVAAAAVPGSPIHLLMTRLLPQAAPAHITRQHALLLSAAESTPASPRSVAIAPHGPASIVFQARQTIGVIRVLTGTTDHLSVQGDGDGATYTVGENVILIDQREHSALSYDVTLPSATIAPDVRIRVGGRTVYQRVGDQIHGVGIADAMGRYTISFAKIAP